MELLTGTACRGNTALLTMECLVARCAENILVRSSRITEGRGFKSHLELLFFSFEFSVESICIINNKIRYENVALVALKNSVQASYASAHCVLSNCFYILVWTAEMIRRQKCGRKTISVFDSNIHAVSISKKKVPLVFFLTKFIFVLGGLGRKSFRDMLLL